LCCRIRFALSTTIKSSELTQNFKEDFKYLQISIHDAITERLIPHFIECSEFIDEGFNEGAVLVHCRQGVSRSSSIVIAYLIISKNMTLQKSFELVKSKRSIICPNSGFIAQLQYLEVNLNQFKDKSSRKESNL